MSPAYLDVGFVGVHMMAVQTENVACSAVAAVDCRQMKQIAIVSTVNPVVVVAVQGLEVSTTEEEHWYLAEEGCQKGTHLAAYSGLDCPESSLVASGWYFVAGH